MKMDLLSQINIQKRHVLEFLLLGMFMIIGINRQLRLLVWGVWQRLKQSGSLRKSAMMPEKLYPSLWVMAQRHPRQSKSDYGSGHRNPTHILCLQRIFGKPLAKLAQIPHIFPNCNAARPCLWTYVRPRA